MSALPPPETCDFHGLPALRLTAPDGATALISHHGAQLLSWIPAGGAERLYLSESAVFDGRQAIRGGVPVIFPQFGGKGKLRHGFARELPWEVVAARTGKDYATATLRLTDGEATRALWPHVFVAEMTVLIAGNRLDMELEVENADDKPCAFTAALHTYLRVQEVENVALQGLQGLRYRDQTDRNKEDTDRQEALVVEDELDRLYLGVKKPLLLSHPGGGAIAMEQEGFPDTVVWNPWEKKCAALKDMPRDGFRRMLCVEAAAAARPVTLEPGDTWFGRQTLVAL
ncbi:MAG: D-hexose-6-phosphate mutarotase [Rhodocyclaceae bacterium]|nr:D-hexose-6-phosphate mutarotase [Rhodocyclaceae bacterium]